MSRFVWEVRAIGGDPTAVREAVSASIERLRYGDTTGIDQDVAAAWSQDVIAAGVVHTVTAQGTTSLVVEVEVRDEDAAHTAALMSTGFDAVVLDDALAVAGVLEVSHSDRIPRQGA